MLYLIIIVLHGKNAAVREKSFLFHKWWGRPVNHFRSIHKTIARQRDYYFCSLAYERAHEINRLTRTRYQISIKEWRTENAFVLYCPLTFCKPVICVWFILNVYKAWTKSLSRFVDRTEKKNFNESRLRHDLENVNFTERDVDTSVLSNWLYVWIL